MLHITFSDRNVYREYILRNVENNIIFNFKWYFAFKQKYVKNKDLVQSVGVLIINWAALSAKTTILGKTFYVLLALVGSWIGLTS